MVVARREGSIRRESRRIEWIKTLLVAGIRFELGTIVRVSIPVVKFAAARTFSRPLQLGFTSCLEVGCKLAA